jgi:hypothetical protein
LAEESAAKAKLNLLPKSVLLKNYAKRKRQQTADTSLSAVIGALAAGFLKP